MVVSTNVDRQSADGDENPFNQEFLVTDAKGRNLLETVEGTTLARHMNAVMQVLRTQVRELLAGAEITAEESNLLPGMYHAAEDAFVSCVRRQRIRLDIWTMQHTMEATRAAIDAMRNVMFDGIKVDVQQLVEHA